LHFYLARELLAAEGKTLATLSSDARQTLRDDLKAESKAINREMGTMMNVEKIENPIMSIVDNRNPRC